MSLLTDLLDPSILMMGTAFVLMGILVYRGIKHDKLRELPQGCRKGVYINVDDAVLRIVRAKYTKLFFLITFFLGVTAADFSIWFDLDRDFHDFESGKSREIHTIPEVRGIYYLFGADAALVAARVICVLGTAATFAGVVEEIERLRSRSTAKTGNGRLKPLHRERLEGNIIDMVQGPDAIRIKEFVKIRQRRQWDATPSPGSARHG